MKTEVNYRGYRITLNPYIKLGPNTFGYSIYEGNSDEYILSTKGPAGNYDKALSSAKKMIDLRLSKKSETISAVSNNQASSYLGESIIAKKSQQTKNILVIIAMLAILIVAYLAVTGKLFKSLQS